jgi:hypothetical protein
MHVHMVFHICMQVYMVFYISPISFTMAHQAKELWEKANKCETEISDLFRDVRAP